MESVKRYYVGKYGLVEGAALGRLSVVLAADFNRVSAENLALQQRLTVQDQRVDELRELLDSALFRLETFIEAEREMPIPSMEVLRDAVQRQLSALNPAAMADPVPPAGGEHQAITRLQAEVERYRILAYIGEHEFDDLTWKARCAELRAEVVRLKEAQAEHDNSSSDRQFYIKQLHARAAKVLSLDGDNTSWFEIVDGLERLQSAPADKGQCQFPQSCTTRCDCDIPDFSPGNGNKARRRAAAIETPPTDYFKCMKGE
ncbi:hypothetical protein [Pseudomonas sp. RL_5y_Pfl2_73]|uniref:hypothetical protein n=1 Tax=Pseudomonas sp. RL_5y_Pfl2_73 TaxID=3088713 RepID=UPI0030DB8032